MSVRFRLRFSFLLTLAVCATFGPALCASAEVSPSSQPAIEITSPWTGLSTDDRRQLDNSIARALAWLAIAQKPDGSFPTIESGQPGVTSLGVLAFLSAGHVPGEGRYGRVIDNAIQYVLHCQHPDGLICLKYPSRPMQGNDPPHTGMYNHAISGLMLSEACGMVRPPESDRMRKTIESALAFTRTRQLVSKRYAGDKEGWRYLQRWQSSDADLSVTSWQLMFLRSARNAGFDVPSQQVDEALAFVHRCYNPDDSTFWYALRGKERVTTRGMVGAGILALSLGGRHQTSEAQQAGKWVLAHPFDRYRATVNLDRFFYGAFYCSQAMFQLGGPYWSGFYPTLLRTLVNNQSPDGSWEKETRSDAQYGNAYTTAMAVLALTPPYQLLPVFQR